MKSAPPVHLLPGTAPGDEWLGHLRLQASLLDGIEVGMLAFDAADRALVWNQTYLRLFPEQAGHIHEGEDYVHNLRRFYTSRLAPAELPEIDRYIEGAVARHHAQTQPFEFEHGGTRLRVSSLPVPGGGRLRVWRTLAPLPAAPAALDFGGTLGGELLEYVPEGLVVCDGSARVLWANASFCALFGLGDRPNVIGATLHALYTGAWMAAHTPADDPRRRRGTALLQDNVRFPGAPFELPLPGKGHCRVIARPARDGSVFYALIDISALKQYEEALQLTLDNAGRGILRYDAEGRVLLFNRQALDLLDLPEHVVAGSVRIKDVIRYQQERGDVVPGAGVVQSVEEMDARLFSNNSYLRPTRDGKVLEIATHVLPDGGAVRTYSDVTAYVRAQQAVAEKTRALEITLDSMSQGISAIDNTGRLVFWNRRYQELLDLPDQVLAGQPTMDRIVRFQIERGDFGPDFAYVDAVARGFVAVGDKLAPLRGPEAYVRKTRDGRTFDVITKPLPDGGVVRTFTDITAYARTQEALVHKQAQLGALVHNLPDRVWLKDANGTFLLANPAFQRRHGFREADIIGRKSEDLFGAEVAQRQAESDRRAMETDAPVVYEDHQFDADGELRFTEVAKVVMRDDEGRPLGLLGIARDITRRKQEEAALIRAKEEAQSASGAKSRFLSSMSHEIRTPMNAVLGMLSLLRTTELSPSQEEYASKAEGAARALLSLLNDILDFSKIEAGQMRLDRRPFSLEQMLADLSVILSANVGERDLEVLYDLDPQVPDALVGDDMRLRQILINLGGNAVKFTERGEVVVRTRLAALADGHASIEFSVQDSGIGITTEQQQKLFGDFVQASDGTARKFGGTGLGLGICRRLTDLMGASLQLASTPGVGSRFWFTVRLPVDASPRPTEPPPAAPGPFQRVLIVDDNPLARDTLAALCRASGWEADTAQDGAQALARIEGAAARGLSYEAVFVDWVMAGMDGWQTCARIRSLHLADSTPLVIMVTAHGREMLQGRTAQDKSLLDGFLVKPVTAGMLRAAVNRVRHAPAPEGAAAAPARPGPLAGLRLLLAEDNPVNQQIARELLVRQGAQVDVVEDGQQALDQVAAAEVPYDAVLMDMQMPVMDGLEATRALRRFHDDRALPIIAMTANAMDNDREACLAAGMNAHVAKPFAINDVVAVILHCIAPPADAPAGTRPAAPVADHLPVFDRADALRRMGGDEDLLRSVLPVFRGNLEEALRELSRSEAADLVRLLHSIKGMAANVSAKALAAQAAAAEQQLRSGPVEGAAIMVRQVQEAIGDVLREIAAQD